VAPHREGGQVQFMARAIAAPLALFADTCAWARQNLAQPLTVDDMAAHAGWAPQELHAEIYGRSRNDTFEVAKRSTHNRSKPLLETTDLTVYAVASRTGLGTTANFRLHFTRKFNTTPSSYRRLYQGRNRKASPA
jgi:transcriptional regulator GlxA family with amidase domain